MRDPVDRRTFMKIAGTSIGVGALFSVAPLLGASPAGRRVAELLGKKNGEAPGPLLLRSALRHARRFLGAAQPARHAGVRECRGRHQRSARPGT
jgi:hypothetical protein